MIHGFTSTGLTETQYVNFSKASNIGHVEEKYISTGKEIISFHDSIITNQKSLLGNHGNKWFLQLLICGNMLINLWNEGPLLRVFACFLGFSTSDGLL